MAETIYALASPPGKGGVAVIRVSGPAAHKSLHNLSNIEIITPRQVFYKKFVDSVSRETIDRGLAVAFTAPHSFTGEDVAEYYLHGGPAIVKHMLAALSRQEGHRLAQPGEFTRRAFENGKLDLTEAEAVADLINAETILQKAQALEQLGGGLATLYEGWAEKLKTMLAHLEADLEFPDEDLPEGVSPQILRNMEALLAEIAAHLDDNRRGERLRDGLLIAVIGAPNAGKSSLVNALARRDVAIVSPHAGTTRDVLEVPLDLGGYPVLLADTAGLRPEQLADTGQDSIESEGIRRALALARKADIKLLVYDASALPARDSHTSALEDEMALIVYNKADKAAGESVENGILVSAATGAGLDTLIAALALRLESLIGRREAPSLTRARHREALQEAASALTRGLRAPLPELVAEDTRLALRAIGRITGRVDAEDLLDVIFRDFCIGK